MLFCLVLVYFFTFSAGAVQTNEIKEKMEDIMSKVSFEDSFLNIKDAEQVSKSALDVRNIFSTLFEGIKSAYKRTVKTAFLIVAVIILSSVAEVFKSEMKTLSKISEYVFLLLIILVCFEILMPLQEYLENYLKSMVTFITAANTSMTWLLACSGSTSCSAVNSASCSFIMGLVQAIFIYIIMPCAKLIISLSAVGALSQYVNLYGIISFIKSFCLWAMGLIFAIFGSVHSLSFKIASSTDSLALRGIRFSAARLIPYAGGMLGESLNTVLASVNVIKSVAGGLGIAYIIYTLIPVIVTIFGVKISVLAGIFTSRLMGQTKLLGFLDGINSSVNILLALCLFVSVTGIIIFAVFMSVMTDL